MSLVNKFILPAFASLMLAFTLISMLAGGVLTQAQNIPGRNQLCGPGGCPLIDNPDAAQGADQNTIANIILNVASLLTFIAGAVAVLAIVYGGILYVTDNGSGESATKGKKILINAVIGLVITIIAFTIVGLVGNLVQGNLGGDLIQSGNQRTIPN
ncbi:MAG: pilin [Patescibacteria group bacterium]